MTFKKTVTFLFAITTSLLSLAQNKVCETSVEDSFLDLNTIGKCAIENFKKSENKGYIKIATRNRYVRKTNNSYAAKFKEDIKVISEKSIKKTEVKEIKLAEKPKVVLVKDYVRFDEVTNIPVFITCAGYEADNKKECVKETFVNSVLENLIYPFDAAAEGIEGVVWVRFIIDKEGYVGNVTTKGPENGMLLEKEANRLISLLPKFIPGKHNNNYVNVEYFMPIDFQLDE